MRSLRTASRCSSCLMLAFLVRNWKIAQPVATGPRMSWRPIKNGLIFAVIFYAMVGAMAWLIMSYSP
jgi:hypothetical protein